MIIYSPVYLFYGLRACFVQGIKFFLLYLAWLLEFWKNYKRNYKNKDDELRFYRDKRK